jgi:deoxyribodipyrimidine photo-lyase
LINNDYAGGMTNIPPIIVWFRNDLRLFDNPALHAAAAETGSAIIPLYIFDTKDHTRPWRSGGASRVWLYHSLQKLSLSTCNHLIFKAGNPLDILTDIIQKTGASAVYWNRCYDPGSIARDQTIKSSLTEKGITARSFNASLLFEPWDIHKDDKTPYRVFTPFWRKGCLGKPPPEKPLTYPDNIRFYPLDPPETQRQNLDLLSKEYLLPRSVRWDIDVINGWAPGEAGAQKRFKTFLENGLSGYKAGRDFPAEPHHTSHLSPHLHFGEISPRQIWHDVHAHLLSGHFSEKDADHFLSELGWREFSYNLLYHTPTLPEKPLQSAFERFPWREDQDALLAWQQGRTGYPIVDAGMRELWQTGYMHNRVRMIVASFLVKNMLMDWRLGHAWFWDTLFDADLANNAASWQWVAGCGADAAPYFRIFNPVLQGEKFDPEGRYVRTYVPELGGLPDAYIHKPWQAPPLILHQAGITLGTTYPPPMMDHQMARTRALAALQSIKQP